MLRRDQGQVGQAHGLHRARCRADVSRMPRADQDDAYAHALVF
jgi:hypothetical protein